MSRFNLRLNCPATAPSASQSQNHQPPSARNNSVPRFHHPTPFVSFNLQVAKNVSPLFAKTSALPPSFSVNLGLPTGFQPSDLRNHLPFSRLRTLKLSCSLFRTSGLLFSAACALFDKKRPLYSCA